MSRKPKNGAGSLVSRRQSDLLTNAEFRMNNKWLTYSSEIALRVLAVIKQNPDLSQVKLAKLLNVSAQQISKIIKGKENLTLETIYNLSQALKTELISFPAYEFTKSESSANRSRYHRPGLSEMESSLVQVNELDYSYNKKKKPVNTKKKAG